MNKIRAGFYRALIVLLVLLTGVANAQINTPAGAIIPFGSNTSYPFGMLPANLPTGGAYGKSTDAANAYNTWKTNYIVACAGSQFRVKFDDPNLTVSEGIAYGMLLSAYAADKALFDGLWAYYKANSNGNGLMNWRISGCSSATGSNGATDSELDAAMALLVADAQWPLATSPYDYTTEATTLINKIKTFEIDGSNFQANNGDAWGNTTDCRNPSYQAPAYYKVYGTAIPADATFWGTNAVNGAYTLIQANANATTGLVSDWSNKAGATSACQAGSTSGLYGYDACRNPWRMATDVIWFNESRARTQCDKIAAYVNSQGAANCGGPRPQNGTGSGGHFATFVSTYAAGVMGGTPATYQTLLNSMYLQTVGVSDFYQNSNPSGYFGNTLRCVSLFMMSGNFWKPGTSLVQEINVQLGGLNIPSGGNVDLGNVQQGTNGDFTFTIQNLGATALSVTNPISITGGGAAKYSILTAPATSVAANGTTTFVLRFTPGAGVTGPFSATLNITNNDATGGENPYVINVLATGTTSATAPEINVQYNGTSYASGSSFNFGNFTQNSIGYKTFTIQNTGTANLTISSIGVTGTGYSLSGAAPTTIAAGATANFTIAQSAGATVTTNTGTFTINNNDGNEAAYVVNLSTSVVTCATSITASQVLQDYDANNNVTLTTSPPPAALFSSTATNPSIGAANPSQTVASITRDATSYVQVRYQPGCGSAGTFDMTNPVISMLIYSPAAGIPLLMSPKTAAGAPIIADYSSDAKTVTTKVNQWERVYFDMSKIAGNTTVRFLDFMIDQLGANGVPSKVYRFDDIRYDVVNCITSLPSSQIFMDYDNERNLNFVYPLGGAGNVLSEVFPNPSATGINTSANVAKFTRQSTLKYQGWRYSGCQNKIDLSANSVISVKVYSGAANIPINMSFTTAAGALVQGVTVKTTVANAWEKLYFDFTASKNSTTIANMDIYPDTGIAFPGFLNYYFDEIRYDNLPCALPATANAGTDITICAGGSATLAGSITNATGSSWSGGAGTFAPNANSLTASYTPSAAEITSGLATLTLATTGMGSGCLAASDQVVITISPALTVSNAGVDQTVCATTATLAGNTATVGTGAWSVVSGTAVVTTPSSPTSGVTGLGVGANTLRWTISNGSCTASTDDVVITRNAPPTAGAGIDQTICATGTSTLAGTITNATGGSWTSSGTGTFAPNNTTLAAVYTPSTADKSAGSVTLTLSSTGNGGCTAGTDAMVLTITPVPTVANAGADQAVCAATATLAGNTATVGTGAWSVVSGTAAVTTASSATSGVTGLTVGTSTLRWTISNGPCTPSTDDVIITRNSPPTAGAGVDQTICATGTATLAGTITIATGGSWTSSGTGTFAPNNTTLAAVYTPSTADKSAGSVTLTLSSTGNGGCTAATDFMLLTITPAPTTSNAGADQAVCAATATLAGNSATVGTGAWSVISGTAVVTTPSSPTSGVTGLSVGTSTLRWTISNSPCAASTDDVVITRNAPPTISAAGTDQTICATSTTLAANAATVGTGSWSVVSGSGTFTSSSSPTSDVTGLGIGANTLRWTISNSPCAASTDDVVINVTGGLTAANAGGDQTVCAANATLSGNTPTTGTGAWSVISGTAVVTTPSSPTSGVTGLTTGTSTLRWTISLGGCTPSTDDVVITRNAPPTVSAAGSDQTICASTTTLAGNTATTGTGAWSVVSGSATFTSSSNPTTGVTGLGIGANTLRWTISNTPCSASADDVVITVTAAPTIAAAGSDQTLCAATTATLAGNTATVGTGSWSVISGSAVVTTPSNPTSGVTGLTTGSSTLRWTISNGSCTPSTDDIVIVVSGTPTASAAGSDQSICATNATLAANAPSSGTGAWSVVSGSATFTNLNSPTTTVTGLGIGANTLRWTISNSPCTASTDDVVINVSGGITTADAGVDQNVLSPATTATLAGNTPTSGTGTWSLVSGTAVITTPGSPTSGVTGLGLGANVLRWTISNAGCTPSTDDVVINVGSVPVATVINGPTTVSANQTNVTYTFSPVNAGSTYTWSVPPGSTIVSSGPGTVTINMGGSPGNVSLTETNPFGTHTTDLPITIGATGVLAGLGTDTFDAYPTPFEESANIKINSTENVQMKIKVMDSKGMVVYSSNEYFTNQNILIGKELSVGIYYVEVNYQNKLQIIKLVKI